MTMVLGVILETVFSAGEEAFVILKPAEVRMSVLKKGCGTQVKIGTRQTSLTHISLIFSIPKDNQ